TTRCSGSVIPLTSPSECQTRRTAGMNTHSPFSFFRMLVLGRSILQRFEVDFLFEGDAFFAAVFFAAAFTGAFRAGVLAAAFFAAFFALAAGLVLAGAGFGFAFAGFDADLAA